MCQGLLGSFARLSGVTLMGIAGAVCCQPILRRWPVCGSWHILREDSLTISGEAFYGEYPARTP